MCRINDIILRKCDKSKGIHLSCNGALVCRYIKNGIVEQAEEVIINNTDTSFDALIDHHDNVHIISGDSKGNILYIKNENEKWLRAHIISSTPEINIDFNNFGIFRHGEKLSVIYTATQKNRTILCHQLLNNESGKLDAICDLSERNKEIFYIVDDAENAWIFCCEKNSCCFGVKKYIKEKNIWSEFYPIISDGENITDFFAISVGEKFYMSYKTNEGLKFRQLVKTELTATENNATLKNRGREKLLSRRYTTNSSQPVLRCENNNIRLLWSSKTIVLSSNAAYNAENWQRMKEERIKNTDTVNTCKLCDANVDSINYDLFYISGSNICLYSYESYFKEERRENVQMDVAKNPYTFMQKSREEIEREKEEIMKRLGITKSDDFFPSETEEMLSQREIQRFSSVNTKTQIKDDTQLKNKDDEILSVLRKISNGLSELSQKIEKSNRLIMNTTQNRKPQDKKKKILVKINKNR